MDFEKMKQWMEVTQKYQNNKFWDMIFEQSPSEEMMGDFENQQEFKKSGHASSKSFPTTDIVLTETAVILLLEIPGALKEDVFLSVSGNKLTVRGVIKSPILNGEAVLTERKYGEFQRIIELPEPTDSNHIQARFDNGILAITYGRTYRQEESIFIQ
jgi:HSP20 family protein